MDRELWSQDIAEELFPRFWLCPTCQQGHLQKKIVTYSETKRSLDAHSHEHWDPDWIDGRVFGILSCGNTSCSEEVVFCGSSTVELEFDTMTGVSTGINIYRPKYFHPPLVFFKISKAVPEEVKAEIINAFGLYWSDLAGCANRIRTALEVILDSQKIARRQRSMGQKSKPLYLHARILIFELKNTKIANYMYAIKWIGNYGSHGQSILPEDLLDAFEILNDIVENLYNPKSRILERKVRKIIKSKRPNSHTKKRKRKIEF